MSRSPLRSVLNAPMTPRRRAWWWAACAAALVVTYLVIWTVYSMAHLSSYARYEQLRPGASAHHLQADFRLLSLVRTDELTAESGDGQIAAAGTVWVVAELEVVQRAQDPNFVCTTRLLGPDRRAWEVASLDITRPTSMFCSDDDLQVGRPYRYEQVYEVPARYADEIYGVVVVNSSDARPNQVLTPPG